MTLSAQSDVKTYGPTAIYYFNDNNCEHGHVLYKSARHSIFLGVIERRNNVEADMETSPGWRWN
jgi:hypothetical protein